MQGLKAYRILFSIAALLFIAKPFVGFAAFNRHSKPRIVHTILVKSFTKRKPETLQEGNAKAEALSQFLTNPLLILFSGIAVLLEMLFPLLIGDEIRKANGFLPGLRYVPVPTAGLLLFSGKLTI